MFNEERRIENKYITKRRIEREREAIKIQIILFT